MNNGGMRCRIAALVSAVAVMTMFSPQAGALSGLPDALVLPCGGTASVEAALPLSASASDKAVVSQVGRENERVLRVTAGEEGTAEVVFRLLGVVPVKTMTVTVQQPRMLIPGGRSLGVAVETEGLVVVGTSDLGRMASPARKAGVRPGDVIRSVDGVPVNDAEALSAMLGVERSVRLEVLRGEERMEFDVTPGVDPRDGAVKLGVWVRESTAGVGTLTFYDPENGDFGALGHAITDVDTGIAFPVGEGAVYENEVVQITRGVRGTPGELTGAFFEEEVMLGEIEKNTEFGIFGEGEAALAEGSLYPQGLPAAARSEVHEGMAMILCTIDGQTVKSYECEIEKVYEQPEPATRSMIVRITDEELLARTGGIVQGMSGSPIIQDGKLVGAVTHV